jgi:membrane-associated phospholipid phosphatase
MTHSPETPLSHAHDPRVHRLTRRCLRLPSGFAVVLALLLLPAATAHAVDPPRVEWSPDWPRFRLWEAVATGLLGVQAATAGLLYPDPGRHWRGGILFDDAVRNAVRLDSYDAREAARPYSDTIYRVLGVYPLLVDNLIVTWAVHGSGDVALEMLGMNLESYALTGALAFTLQEVGRERPAARGCADDPAYSPKCDDYVALNKSFFSGHTAVNFTAAGLICAHHQHLPLYGGGFPDLAICLVGLGAATTQGALRMMTDDHYSTDVLVGAGVGVFSGYILPQLLHYGFGSGKPEHTASLFPTFTSTLSGVPLVAMLSPQIDANYAGLELTGQY